MSDTAEKLATHEDLLAVPDTLVAEIIPGQRHTPLRPGPRHTSASLGAEIAFPHDYESCEGKGTLLEILDNDQPVSIAPSMPRNFHSAFFGIEQASIHI